MTANIVNQIAYLQTSREFPEEVVGLSTTLSKAYIDTAEAVNVRTIGIFPTNRSAITGEGYFLTTQRQQTLRQVYTFTAAGNIAHGINFNSVSGFTHCFGSFTDGTNHYGVIYASDVPIAGQITFYITPNVGVTPGNIVVLDGGGTPILLSGIIVLTWLSKI